MILFPLSAILLITTSSDSVIVPTTLVPSEYLKPVNPVFLSGPAQPVND